MPSPMHGILIFVGNSFIAESKQGKIADGANANGVDEANADATDVEIAENGVDDNVDVQGDVHGYDFEWQSMFHEHIIRDEESFQRIRNPRSWNNDKFYK